MENSTTILAAIENWSVARTNSKNAFNLLNQGYSVAISRAQYEKWNENSDVTSLHIYPAVFDNQLMFVAIDNVSDQEQSINYENVFVLDYTYGRTDTDPSSFPPGSNNITVQEALERIFRWMMNKEGWLNQAIAKRENEVFQVFVVPFTDLTTLFASTTNDYIYGLIGLKSDGLTDMLLWNDTISFTPYSVADVSYTCPPFGQSINEFQLLVQSAQ